MEMRYFVVIMLMVFSMAGSANAFKIKPTATNADGTVIQVEREGRWWDSLYPVFIDMFTQPVHESITNQIYGCKAENAACGEANGQFAPEEVLAGARWNDNPPFKLDSVGKGINCPLNTTIKLPRQSECWYGLYNHAKKHANDPDTLYDAKSGKVILYRIHFGDLQFVHSMASRDNVPAKATYDDIMAWAEFTYKVARGDIDRGTPLGATGITRVDELLAGKGLTVQLLFVRGDGQFQNKESVKKVAFGSFLHMIEDSFSNAHTDRDGPPGARCPGDFDQPGRIASFHSYVNQKKSRHADEDIYSALVGEIAESGANVVYVGKAIKSLYDDNSKTWEKIRPSIECIYQLNDNPLPSGPGVGFER